MDWGRKLVGLLFGAAIAAASAANHAHAATIIIGFSGTLDEAIPEQSIPAGASFEGTFAFDTESAPFFGSSPLERLYPMERFTLQVAGATAIGPGLPLGTVIDSNFNFGSTSSPPVFHSQLTGYGIRGPLVQNQWGALITFRDAFVGDPLLQLPPLSYFEFLESVGPIGAFIDIGPPDPLAGFAQFVPYRGSITDVEVLATPIPPAALLFLSAMAGLVVIRYRRQ